MRRAELAQFVLLEVIGVVVAASVFQLLESRLLAGMIAGAYFINSGAYMLWRIVQWPDRFRSFTLYPLLIHVFAISFPIVIVRALNINVDFNDLMILGVPGPVFHRISTIVYGILIFATIGDLTRARRALAK